MDAGITSRTNRWAPGLWNRRLWHSSACALLLLLFCRPAFPLDPTKRLTQYVHRIWQSPQGLPDATITSILQSKDGYLWLGTETGLVRFDGVRFSSIDDTNQGPLKHNWVRTLLEDRQRGLWIGTNDAGLIRLDHGVATQYSPEEDLARANVQCLVTDSREDLWACTSNGIARLAQGKLTVYRTGQGLPTNNIRAGCAATDGTLWFGGDDSGLSSWTGSGFLTHHLASMPSYGAVRALLCSADGTLWIGTTNGLIRYKAGRERLFTAKDGLADDWVYCLLQTSDSTLWIGTKNGFSRLQDGDIESFRTEDGLSQSTVYSLYEDREGSLWVGTKHGLNQFIDGRAIPYTVSEGLPSNDTGPVLQDHAGAIWIGTLGAGLCRFEDGHCRALTTKDGLPGNYVYSLAEDQEGDVWVGTNAGLSRLRGGRVYQTYTTAEGLPANTVRFLSRDHGGGLWIGTLAGLTLFQDGKFIQPRGVHEASSPSILGGGDDGDGHFLAATEAGVSMYRNGEFHGFAPDDMPLREVDTVYADPEGLVWMGTFGSGLRLLKGGKAFSFFMRDGLFDSDIYGIVPDGQDRLWMASSKGIFSVNRSDLRKFANGEIQKFVSTPYSPLDGLRTIECKSGIQPAVWKMRDGRLWFSTIRGLLVIDPAKLQRNSPVPPVVIEDVTVNGQGESADQIGKLPPGRRDLEFRYTALSFLVPTGINFRYILDGYDTNWTDAGNRRVAYYTNLPPGQFRFRVTACNSDGICNESGSSVEFALARHYYQRVWFFPLCAAFLAAGLWLGWRQRVQGLKKHFEIVLAERSRIARELHDTLIQGFSGITMGMQAVSMGLPPCEEQSQLKELIHDAANSLKQARESVAGLRGVKEADAELSGAIAEVAGQLTKAKDVRLKLKLDQGPPNLGAEIEYNLLRIVQEAVTNAMKHSGASTIEIGLHCTPEQVGLSIEDNGQGFVETDEFTQTGHYGLAGMRERATEIGAEFELVTGPAKGTTICVRLPRKNGAHDTSRPEILEEYNGVR
jgi:ligand-binding sensor domain-containing protein/signal transduction histidine kinase